MQTEIITKLGSAELHTKDGNVSASLDSDVWKVAAFDRIHGTNKHSIGFLENFGADIGAFASTWSFHENDMIVIGSNDSDMAIACKSSYQKSRWTCCSKIWKDYCIITFTVWQELFLQILLKKFHQILKKSIIQL